MSRMKFITSVLIGIATVSAAAQERTPSHLWTQNANTVHMVMNKSVYGRTDAYPRICRAMDQNMDTVSVFCTTEAAPERVRVSTFEFSDKVTFLNMNAPPGSDKRVVEKTLDAMFTGYLYGTMSDDELTVTARRARERLLMDLNKSGEVEFNYPDLRIIASIKNSATVVNFLKR